MQKATRFKVIFTALCASLFVVACVATAQLMIQLIWWYLGTCRSDTSLCLATDLLITYWWVLFVPCTLLMALFAHRIYMRLSVRFAP